MGLTTVWGAMMGGVLMPSGTGKRFRISQLVNPGFLKYFVLEMALRFLWNMDISAIGHLIEESGLSPKKVPLTIVVWGAVFVLPHRGIYQVNGKTDKTVHTED